MTARSPLGATGTPRRVAFYSHDTQGLGHVRRNLALASAVVAADAAVEVLLLTGNPEAASLPSPPRTEIVTMPTVGKDTSGGYDSRVLLSPLSFTVGLRRSILTAALDAFAPDVFVVDKVPLGFRDELIPALRLLRRAGRTSIVLGLREILDDPVTTMREWDAAGSSRAVTDYYDAVWVYGDRTVYDLVREYRLPSDVADKIIYTGYLGHGRGAATLNRRASTTPPANPYVLCLVGGGQDGYALAESFVSATMPDGHRGVILTGPFMQEAQRHRLELLSRANPRVVIMDFVTNPEVFIDRARATVSMAGYNSVCEVLSTGKPALLVPRTVPRTEQLVRARRLSDLGLADVALPEDVAPGLLARWLAHAVDRPQAGPHPVDLDGLSRIAELVDVLCERFAHAV